MSLNMNSLEIKSIRKQLGKTQKELAKMLGVGLRAVQTWESGERNISQSALILLKYIVKENEQSAGSEVSLKSKKSIGIDDLFQEILNRLKQLDVDNKNLAGHVRDHKNDLADHEEELDKLKRIIVSIKSKSSSS